MPTLSVAPRHRPSSAPRSKLDLIPRHSARCTSPQSAPTPPYKTRRPSHPRAALSQLPDVIPHPRHALPSHSVEVLTALATDHAPTRAPSAMAHRPDPPILVPNTTGSNPPHLHQASTLVKISPMCAPQFTFDAGSHSDESMSVAHHPPHPEACIFMRIHAPCSAPRGAGHTASKLDPIHASCCVVWTRTACDGLHTHTRLWDVRSDRAAQPDSPGGVRVRTDATVQDYKTVAPAGRVVQACGSGRTHPVPMRHSPMPCGVSTLFKVSPMW
ncbi:hypothetical protein JB92DRAFT_3232310 [Gautieria morchelliformis]|nr:hypothetical protein JB92DRAFT_3232310 [Gautieria morchelliformis]